MDKEVKMGRPLYAVKFHRAEGRKVSLVSSHRFGIGPDQVISTGSFPESFSFVNVLMKTVMLCEALNLETVMVLSPFPVTEANWPILECEFQHLISQQGGAVSVHLDSLSRLN